MRKTGSDKRCGHLWLVLGIVALLSLLAVLVPWWSQWRSERETLTLIQARIGRQQALIGRRPEIEKALRKLDRELERRRYFVAGETPAVATARLQQQIKNLVDGAGGALLSSQGLTGGKDRKGWITLAVRMKGDTNVLARFLQALNRHRPVARMEELTVRRHSRYRQQGRRMKKRRGTELEIGFRITSRWRGPES